MTNIKYRIEVFVELAVFFYILYFLQDILFSPEINERFILISLFLFIALIKKLNIEHRIYYLCGLLSVALIPFFTILHSERVSEKLGIWALLFFFIGASEEIIKLYNERSKRLTLDHIFYLLKINIITGHFTVDSYLLTTFHSLRSSTLKLVTQTIYYTKLFVVDKNPITASQWIWVYVKSFMVLFFGLFLILLFTVIIMMTNIFISGKRREQTRRSLNPVILLVEPKIIYRSSRILIKGRNLGWKPDDEKLRLMTQFGEISKDNWTESEIILTVPLHWKDGIIQLWVEKPITWNGKAIIAKSEIKTIQLIPSSNTFTPLDDLFFQQLKLLSKETLEINGYAPSGSH
ncbi:hypothetical protein HY214_01295 [Candidatus Roizmanbacteria bacterium]|nr:hypothetical protein [Candidatus Roizmanbacteria bacterium]